MNTKNKFSCAALLISSVVAASSASAAIYTMADFTRTAGGASTSTAIDFVPSAGSTEWSGAPANAISGEEFFYLTTTVSWTSNAAIGTFNVNTYFHEDGGAGRWGVGTVGSGFGLTGGNAYSATDPDGAGPATAGPGTAAAVDTTVTTSVNLVLRINQVQANTSPGGDYWFTDTSLQAGSASWMWIDPNLAASEASQPTAISQWRSSNTRTKGIRFTTDTDGTDLVFSDIAIYTGTDTPFGAVPEPSSTALLGLGGLALILRRRK